MGKMQTKQLANGNTQLEITYGGADFPFGGVDASAPPAYIDPRSFIKADGAIVVNNKLCTLTLSTNVIIPTLFSGVVGVVLLGAGTFYNSLYGQLNYVLGYTSASFSGPPGGNTYTFYITSWKSEYPNTVYNEILAVDLYDDHTAPTNASIVLPCIASSSINTGGGIGATGSVVAVDTNGNIQSINLTGGAGYSVGELVEIMPVGYAVRQYAWVTVTTIGAGEAIDTVTVQNGGRGYQVGSVTAGLVESAALVGLSINGTSVTINTYTGGNTTAGIVSELVTQINQVVGTIVAATSSYDGTSVILTAIEVGSAGNSITVQDVSTGAVAGATPPFYFPVKTQTTLQNGQDQVTAAAPTVLHNASATSEGGTIYFGNLGPMILKYGGPGQFDISSMYQGVSILSKFAGSLLGIGIIPQLGFEVQNQDMIFAWTAGGKLDTWSPLNASGNVTGAGFEQLADIGEPLTGLIVSNGTAFILRKEGVSYATATGNSLVPFNVNHIGLGPQGEGTQTPYLVTQYDSVGAYVGNTDVWQLTGSISPIGSKIRQLIFPQLAAQTIPDAQLAAVSGAVNIGGDEFPIAAFAIGDVVYVFNTSNGTWTTVTLNSVPFPSITRLVPLVLTPQVTTANPSNYTQTQIGFAIQQTLNGGTEAPLFLTFTEPYVRIADTSNGFDVVFPVEEVIFGRDVTIDALYVALQGQFNADVTFTILVNGEQYAVYSLLASSFTDINANPIELQIFPATATGIFTAHAPQLQFQLESSSLTDAPLIRFTKITMFGSIDANQRPV